MSADAHHDHHHHPTPFSRILVLLSAEKRDVAIVVLYAAAIGVLNLAAPLTAMAVVNSVALATLTQQLLVMSLALLLALGLSSLLQGLQSVIVEFIQRRVFVRVADDLAHRLPRADVTAFDRRNAAELVNRFFDVLTVQKAGATLLLDGVAIALQVVIGLLLLGFYDPMLLGFDVVLILSLAFLVFVLGRGAVRTAIDESIAKYAVAGWLEELARNPIGFKTAGGPAYAAAATSERIETYLQTRRAHFRVVFRQFAFALVLQAVANTALLAIGGYLVIQEKLSLGQLVAAEIVVTLVVASFSKLGKQLESYYDLLAASDKLGHLFDVPLERAGGVPHAIPAGDGSTVLARGLGYTYPGDRRPALAGFEIDVKPSERVAIVGPNGAGKSTFLDLLLGLRVPDAGRVEIDGLDLRDGDLESVRSHVAVVKGLELFDGSLVDNVRVGRDGISLPDVRAVLDAVGLLEAVLGMPDGLNTRLTHTGAPLSFGQANRLMLARALAGKPRLLILDETLDSLDGPAREKIVPALFGPEATRTLLVVTHVESVAALCGRVVRIPPQ